MCKVRYILFILFIYSCESFELGKSTELLYKLTNYAIESRRIRNPCSFESGETYFKCMTKFVTNRPTSNYVGFNHHNPIYRPQVYSSYNNPQSIMEVLYTISQNDALRCVPRLLCEVTSMSSRSRQSVTLPNIPFNLDLESMIKLLATIDFPGGSPIPTFAKAALLGYVSRGNSDSCLEAYPTCPRDPNKLIQYLNNYNGGFFRYFNGIYSNAQKRIQTKPNNEENDVFRYGSNRLAKKLTFPKDDNSGFNEFAFKKPKELPFSINEYYTNELDLQKPLPNHRATPIIFPLRTGTGDLRLDSEELDANYNHKQYNNNFVSFIFNEDFYNRVPQATREFNPHKAAIAFPA